MSTAAAAYAGDLDVNDVWVLLEKDKDAVLVDVRTRAEWSFVGLPDLSTVNKTPVLIEWQSYPAMDINGDFVDALDAAFSQRGLSKSAPIVFLCRSGVRSKEAAIAATEQGYASAYNVAGGFEGPLGPDRRRGSIEGWKAAGLPWIQS